MSGSITFENILSIRALEWLVTLVGCKINGKNELVGMAMLIMIQEIKIQVGKYNFVL